MITISTHLTYADALARLERLVVSSQKSHRFAAELSGSTIRLMYTPRIGRSELRPQFVGTVVSVSTGSEVRGDVRLSPRAHRLRAGGYVIGTLWTLAALVITQTQPGPPTLKLLPLAGIAIMGLNTLFIRFARTYYRDDETLLVRTLSEAFDG
jgi:hypothetical protein